MGAAKSAVEEPGSPVGERAASDTPRGRRDDRWRLKRLFSGLGVLFWIALPVLSILAVVGYFAASIALGTTPPFAVVDGQSMRPTYNPGDLVVIKGVASDEIEVGDVLAINTPQDFVEERGFQSEIVHRVVRIESGPGYIDIITKGDNNPEEDPFLLRPGHVRGEVVARYPGVGFPVLFARAEQGRIFLAAIGLAIIGYFLIAAIERRQEAAELESPRVALAVLAEETHENRESLEELIGAVSEYGYHLRSHTEILQSMSAASQHLAQVTSDLGRALPTLGRPERAVDLLAHLRAGAYAEWSLLATERAAVAIGWSPRLLIAELVRLAAVGDISVSAVQSPDLYRYRLL